MNRYALSLLLMASLVSSCKQTTSSSAAKDDSKGADVSGPCVDAAFEVENSRAYLEENKVGHPKAWTKQLCVGASGVFSDENGFAICRCPTKQNIAIEVESSCLTLEPNDDFSRTINSGFEEASTRAWIARNEENLASCLKTGGAVQNLYPEQSCGIAAGSWDKESGCRCGDRLFSPDEVKKLANLAFLDDCSRAFQIADAARNGKAENKQNAAEERKLSGALGSCKKNSYYEPTAVNGGLSLSCRGITWDRYGTPAQTYYSVSLEGVEPPATSRDGIDQILVTLASDSPDFLPEAGRSYTYSASRSEQNGVTLSANVLNNKNREASEPVTVKSASVRYVNPSKGVGSVVTVQIALEGVGDVSKRTYSIDTTLEVVVVPSK